MFTEPNKSNKYEFSDFNVNKHVCDFLHDEGTEKKRICMCTRVYFVGKVGLLSCNNTYSLRIPR